ncbi:hypothetical protein PtB15_15B154 [Puccinia triticina]|nr:hypothetical protein PtB15_15B154 [Puccinia triticina]
MTLTQKFEPVLNAYREGFQFLLDNYAAGGSKLAQFNPANTLHYDDGVKPLYTHQDAVLSGKANRSEDHEGVEEFDEIF